MIKSHSTRWSSVSAREDVDGTTPTVIYTPNRNVNDPLEKLEILMTPTDARKLARALNKAAKRLSS